MKQIYVLVVLAPTEGNQNSYAKVLTYDDWLLLKLQKKDVGGSYVKIESSQQKRILESACYDINSALTGLDANLYRG